MEKETSEKIKINHEFRRKYSGKVEANVQELQQGERLHSTRVILFNNPDEESRQEFLRDAAKVGYEIVSPDDLEEELLKGFPRPIEGLLMRRISVEPLVYYPVPDRNPMMHLRKNNSN